MARRFAFDPVKDELNRAKHGVALTFRSKVFEDPQHLVLASHRPVDGEERFKAVGRVDDWCWTAVFVEREAFTRLISVRRSNGGEQRDYDRYSGRPQ